MTPKDPGYPDPEEPLDRAFDGPADEPPTYTPGPPPIVGAPGPGPSPSPGPSGPGGGSSGEPWLSPSSPSSIDLLWTWLGGAAVPKRRRAPKRRPRRTAPKPEPRRGRPRRGAPTRTPTSPDGIPRQLPPSYPRPRPGDPAVPRPSPLVRGVVSAARSLGSLAALILTPGPTGPSGTGELYRGPYGPFADPEQWTDSDRGRPESPRIGTRRSPRSPGAPGRSVEDTPRRSPSPSPTPGPSDLPSGLDRIAVPDLGTVPKPGPVAEPGRRGAPAPVAAPFDVDFRFTVGRPAPRPGLRPLNDPLELPWSVAAPLPAPSPRPSPEPLPIAPPGAGPVPDPFAPGAPVLTAAPQPNPDRCNCPKPKPRKPRKPRSECKRGTYKQTARGIIYNPKETVPCQ